MCVKINYTFHQCKCGVVHLFCARREYLLITGKENDYSFFCFGLPPAQCIHEPTYMYKTTHMYEIWHPDPLGNMGDKRSVSNI